MKLNYIHHLWFDKKYLTDPFKGYPRTWDLLEKIKSAIPREQNYAACDWSKMAKQFSVKLKRKISLSVSVSGKQASSRPGGQQALSLESSFLRILDTFQLLF